MNIDNYINTSISKVSNKPIKTFILAIYSGIFISLAAILATTVSISINNYSISKILQGLVFPIGLVLVSIFQTELFTGNSLLIIPLLKKKITLKQLLKNYLLVYLGNFSGAIIISLLIYNTPLKILLQDSLITIATNKISLNFSQAIILGILCNFLVCSAIFLSSNAKNILEKIILIYIPIFTFIVLSFEHSIANMYYLTMGYILDNTITIKEILFNNLLPVTIGNILGGFILGISIVYINKN